MLYASSADKLAIDRIKNDKVIPYMVDPSAGFRVIIVIEANSYVNIKSSRLLPKFKTQKINSWCAA
ncbi:restriction endonuclease subunit M [Streptococcus agalactiae]